jgi:hypothetical protein
MLTEDMLEKVMDFNAQIGDEGSGLYRDRMNRYPAIKHIGEGAIESSVQITQSSHVRVKRIYDEHGRFVRSEKTWVDNPKED